MGILSKNGTLVTSLDRMVGDVRCEDGSIVEIGTDLDSRSGDTVVDASGQYVFPGGLDPHVRGAGRYLKREPVPSVEVGVS